MSSETTTPVEPSRISDYERAVCYYAMSRPGGGVTLALILVYALCVLEALAALIYGLVTENKLVTAIGTWALAGIILLGVIAFMARGLAAEIRRRRALAIARQAPDPEILKDIPDPFSDHILLRRSLDEGNEGFEIKDLDGHTVYTVRLDEDGTTRRVLDPDGNERLAVKITSFAGSFSIEGMLPRRAEVSASTGHSATIRRRFSLGAPFVEVVEGQGRDARRYSVREGGVYRNTRLIGRIYLLRDHIYLDVEEAALGTGLLGLLVSLCYEKTRTAAL